MYECMNVCVYVCFRRSSHHVRGKPYRRVGTQTIARPLCLPIAPLKPSPVTRVSRPANLELDSFFPDALIRLIDSDIAMCNVVCVNVRMRVCLRL